jgi:enamine deaminase RidA (YjgF/YER057c/UK114 family)
MKTFRNPPDVCAPIAGYSHQAELSGAQRLLVMSGQIGQRPDGTVPADPLEQLAVALDNIARNLHAAGMEVRDIVKLTTYVVGELDVTRRRKIMGDWLAGHRPCMTMVFVAGLAVPELKVEIDAWASREG